MQTQATRTAGWATLAGGLCHAAAFSTFGLMLTGLVPALRVLDEQHWLAHLCEVPGMGLLALGIAGIYLNYRGMPGRLGRVGTYIAVGGLGAEAIAGALIAAGEPLTGIDSRSGLLQAFTHAPGLIGILFGSLLLGIAMLRAHVLPRRATAPFMTAVAAVFVLTFCPIGDPLRLALPALISLGWAWIGCTLLTGETRPRVRQAPLAA
jgi:hypothetical protein